MSPTPLIFFAACLLLATRIPPAVCRAADLTVFDVRSPNGEIDPPPPHNLKEKLFRSMGQNPKSMMIRSQLSPEYLQMVKDIFAKEATRFLRELSLNARSLMSAQEADQDVREGFAGNSKRAADPPSSLDLTFHLLREMIEIAKNENQWKQADHNRKIMDAIGK